MVAAYKAACNEAGHASGPDPKVGIGRFIVVGETDEAGIGMSRGAPIRSGIIVSTICSTTVARRHPDISGQQSLTRWPHWAAPSRGRLKP